jgi:hypothetical protein
MQGSGTSSLYIKYLEPNTVFKKAGLAKCESSKNRAERCRARDGGARWVKQLPLAATLASNRPASPRNRRGPALSCQISTAPGGSTCVERAIGADWWAIEVCGSVLGVSTGATRNMAPPGILVLGLAVSLWCPTGFSVGDQTAYSLQSMLLRTCRLTTPQVSLLVCLPLLEQWKGCCRYGARLRAWGLK